MDASVIAGMVVAAAILVFGLVVGVRALIDAARRRSSPPLRDDQLRAGSPTDPDARTATVRANGTTAWMRPDGGGL